MNREITQTYPQNVAKPLPISQGGTGAKTPAQALLNLGAVPASALNTIGGPIGLDENDKIPPQFLPESVPVDNVSLLGPSTAYWLNPTIYTLTDYDIGQSYVISATNGSITRNLDEITYTPVEDANSGTITINSRTYSIVLEATRFSEPVLDSLTPAGAAARNLSMSVNFYGAAPSEFAALKISLYKIENSVETLIREDFANFTLSSSIHNYSVTHLLGNLAGNTTYLLKIQAVAYDINDNQVLDSLIFTSGQFTTGDVIATSQHQYIDGLTSNESITNLGDNHASVKLSGNGEFLAILSHINSNPGILIYQRNNVSGVYNYLQNIFINGDLEISPSIYNFGILHAFSGDGNLLFILHQDAAPSHFLTVDIYKYNAVAGSFQYLSAMVNSTIGNEPYGRVLDIAANNAGDVVAYSQHATSHETGGKDVVYIAAQQSPNWASATTDIVQYADIDPTEEANNTFNSFGQSLAFDSTGNRLVIGVRDSVDNGELVGSAYVLLRSGNDWLLEQKLVPADRLASGVRVGECVSINADGSVIAVSAVRDVTTAAVGEGNVLLFKRTGVTWTLFATLSFLNVNSTNSVASGFGYSVKLSSDGVYVLITAPHSDIYSLVNSPDNKGMAFIFKIMPDNSVTLLSELYDPAFTTGEDNFGLWGDMSADASIVAIASPKQYADPGTFTSAPNSPNVSIFK